MREEECRSLPGVFVKVQRSKTVRLIEYDLDGIVIDKVLTGLEARGWQVCLGRASPA